MYRQTDRRTKTGEEKGLPFMPIKCFVLLTQRISIKNIIFQCMRLLFSPLTWQLKTFKIEKAMLNSLTSMAATAPILLAFWARVAFLCVLTYPPPPSPLYVQTWSLHTPRTPPPPPPTPYLFLWKHQPKHLKPYIPEPPYIAEQFHPLVDDIPSDDDDD